MRDGGQLRGAARGAGRGCGVRRAAARRRRLQRLAPGLALRLLLLAWLLLLSLLLLLPLALARRWAGAGALAASGVRGRRGGAVGAWAARGQGRGGRGGDVVCRLRLQPRLHRQQLLRQLLLLLHQLHAAVARRLAVTRRLAGSGCGCAGSSCSLHGGGARAAGRQLGRALLWHLLARCSCALHRRRRRIRHWLLAGWLRRCRGKLGAASPSSRWLHSSVLPRARHQCLLLPRLLPIACRPARSSRLLLRWLLLAACCCCVRGARLARHSSLAGRRLGRTRPSIHYSPLWLRATLPLLIHRLLQLGAAAAGCCRRRWAGRQRAGTRALTGLSCRGTAPPGAARRRGRSCTALAACLHHQGLAAFSSSCRLLPRPGGRRLATLRTLGTLGKRRCLCSGLRSSLRSCQSTDSPRVRHDGKIRGPCRCAAMSCCVPCRRAGGGGLLCWSSTSARVLAASELCTCCCVTGCVAQQGLHPPWLIC